jgi:hypothetical protein
MSNKMKKYFILIIVLIFAYYSSCYMRKKQFQKISENLSCQWISDSTGCLNYRSKIVEDSFNTIEKFVGEPEEEFVKYFGLPYEAVWDDKSKKGYYWVTCNKVRIRKKDLTEKEEFKTNNEATLLFFKSINGVIAKVGCIVP